MSKFHTTKASSEIQCKFGRVEKSIHAQITLENVGGIDAAAFMKTFPILEKNNSFYLQNQFPTSETLGRTGTSLWRSN